ncbi:MAG: hypothetical protein IT385_25600 [Deltaproteobacteria bacterium]|nr:hypothetical protein [Deltaproteobacteria bacterium]
MVAVVVALSSVACGGEEKPETPEGELASIAWELMAPLGASHECKKIGDALAPWLEGRAPRFQQLVAQVTKLTGANANNFDRVEMRLKDVATRCVNPTGPRTSFTEHDARVARVAGMFPKTRMGFELR